MTMKKSLIAVAVAGAVGVPMSAAQAAEAYGTFGLQLQTTSVSSDGAPSTGYFFNSNGDDDGITMFDGYESRFGFRGDEDLGNGLTASYQVEIGSNFDGYNNQGSDFDLRLGNLGLSGDFGSVEIGTIWSALYKYSGWNIWRTPSNGSFVYNTLTGTSGLGDVSAGLRIDNAIQYTYGAGGYGSDPFTFTIEGTFEDGNTAPGSGTADRTTTTSDEETLNSMTLAGQAVFGDIAVNAVHYSENNTSGPEPSLISLGGEWSPGGPYWVGASYLLVDTDNASGDEPSGLQVTGGMDFGGGWSGIASIGNHDADGFAADVDSQFFLHVKRDLSSRTYLYADFESVELSDDTGAGVVTTGIQHSF